MKPSKETVLRFKVFIICDNDLPYKDLYTNIASLCCPRPDSEVCKSHGRNSTRCFRGRIGAKAEFRHLVVYLFHALGLTCAWKFALTWCISGNVLCLGSNIGYVMKRFNRGISVVEPMLPG